MVPRFAPSGPASLRARPSVWCERNFGRAEAIHSAHSGASRLHSADRPRAAGAPCSGDLADVVGNVRVALAKGLRRTDGGVLAGLMLHLGIELGPEQDDESRNPEPH